MNNPTENGTEDTTMIESAVNSQTHPTQSQSPIPLESQPLDNANAFDLTRKTVFTDKDVSYMYTCSSPFEFGTIRKLMKSEIQ